MTTTAYIVCSHRQNGLPKPNKAMDDLIHFSFEDADSHRRNCEADAHGEVRFDVIQVEVSVVGIATMESGT